MKEDGGLKAQVEALSMCVDILNFTACLGG